MIRIILTILHYPLVLALLTLSSIQCWNAMLWVTEHWAVYQWFGVGIAVYIALHMLPFVNRNLEFLRTFSHELTHTVFGLIFFRKIASFHVHNGGEGEVEYYDGRFGDMFIGLSPYCFPIFTYVFIFLRLLAKDATAFMWFDILIGYTLMFHIFCFASQIGNYQSDIYKRGYFKSYLFIVTFWIFNVTVILLSIRMGIGKTNVFLWGAFCTELIYAWDWVASLWNEYIIKK